MLHKVDHLAVKLDLENTRVHKQLHGIRVEQVLTITQLATEVFDLSTFHRCLSKVKYRLWQFNRSYLFGYDRDEAAREKFLKRFSKLSEITKRAFSDYGVLPMSILPVVLLKVHFEQEIFLDNSVLFPHRRFFIIHVVRISSLPQHVA